MWFFWGKKIKSDILGLTQDHHQAIGKPHQTKPSRAYFRAYVWFGESQILIIYGHMSWNPLSFSLGPIFNQNTCSATMCLGLTLLIYTSTPSLVFNIFSLQRENVLSFLLTTYLKRRYLSPGVTRHSPVSASQSIFNYDKMKGKIIKCKSKRTN